jgi:hypothetical protein
MAWFDNFFSPYDFFPGGPARIPGAVPITPQNTLPSRNGYYPRDEREVPDMRVNVGGPQPAGDVNPVWNMIGVPTMTGPMGPNPHGQLGADLMYSPNLYPGAAARNPARNPVPAASPPPPAPPTDMMPGGMPDTLPAINSVPYAGKVSPAGEGNPPRNSFDWGPDASLWSMLTQGGAAMMQPSWYGLGGQLGQGLTAAGQAAQQAPMQRAQRKLLEAQVGEVESKGNQRKLMAEFARTADLPPRVRAAFLLAPPDKALDVLKEFDPQVRDSYMEFVAAKAKATLPAEINKMWTWGVRGYDAGGKPIYGPVNPLLEATRGASPTGTPPASASPTGSPPAPPPSYPGAPGAPPAAPARPSPAQGDIPPPPPGVDPYKWAEEQAKLRIQKQANEASRKERAPVVLQDIDRALDAIKDQGMRTGLPGVLARQIPGTGADKLERVLDGVRAQIGFDQLNQMRQSSPTGAALGSVTERELHFLQSVMGSLSISQGEDQLRFNLKRLKNAMLDVIHGKDQGPGREKLDAPGARNIPPPPPGFR